MGDIGSGTQSIARWWKSSLADHRPDASVVFVLLVFPSSSRSLLICLIPFQRLLLPALCPLFSLLLPISLFFPCSSSIPARFTPLFTLVLYLTLPLIPHYNQTLRTFSHSFVLFSIFWTTYLLHDPLFLLLPHLPSSLRPHPHAHTRTRSFVLPSPASATYLSPHSSVRPCVSACRAVCRRVGFLLRLGPRQEDRKEDGQPAPREEAQELRHWPGHPANP